MTNMADVKQVLCCASSAKSAEERCLSCQSSCSCADGQCQCSRASNLHSLQTRPYAGSDAVKACGDICRCNQQCPCRKAGCGNAGIEVSLCSDQAGVGVSCTMPGNCGCNKGTVGKL